MELKRHRLTEWTLKIGIGLLLLGACIELLAEEFGLPHIPTILFGINALWSEGILSHDVQVSTARWFIGWLIGANIGIILGLLTGRIKPVRVSLEGGLVLFRAIPFISLVPLSLRIFGLAETGKILLVAWASAGICWIVVHQTALEIPAHLVWRAKSLGASWHTWVFKVLLPSCRDGIYSALRTSLSLGLIVIAVAELSGVYERSSGFWWSEGLGYRLFRSLDESRDDLLMGSIIIFAFMGIIVDQLFVSVSSLIRSLSFKLRQRRVAQIVGAARSMADHESMWEDPPPLKTMQLHAGYNGNTIIQNLSFEIPAGATMSIVGPSGCGKTTLIRAIGHFTDEAFNVSGQVIAGKAETSMSGTWVGVVLQDAPVFEHLTVWDNLVFGSRFHLVGKNEAIRSAWRLLSEFGLEPLATQRAGTLSGGQRQRLALAMVLANRPLILLLDEPFGALDAITRRQLQHFYWQHVHGRVTAVFVTHDLEEALVIGDSVRVGVTPDARMLTIDKQGLPPHQWELHDNFSQLRRTLIESLEKSGSVSAIEK